jgi:hypothetical protein
VGRGYKERVYEGEYSRNMYSFMNGKMRTAETFKKEGRRDKGG